MSHFNTCAVCDTAIGHNFLMCPGHWHLVPRQMKSEVYRCWIELRATAHLTSGPQAQQARDEYHQVRDAAIKAVHDVLKAREEHLQRLAAKASPITTQKGGPSAHHE